MKIDAIVCVNVKNMIAPTRGGGSCLLGSPCFDLPLKMVSWFFACIYCFLTYPRSVLWPTVHILFSDLLYFCRMCFLTYPNILILYRLCFLTYPIILILYRLCVLTYSLKHCCIWCFLLYPYFCLRFSRYLLSQICVS